MHNYANFNASSIIDNISEKRKRNLFRLKLTRLMIDYENELKQGKETHAKDYAAAVVLHDLAHDDLSLIEHSSLDEITLYSLIKSRKCEVPPLDVIRLIKKKYKKDLTTKACNDIDATIKNLVATSWLEAMVLTGLIKENDEIKETSNYILTDYITDDKLMNIIDDVKTAYNNDTITLYNWKRKIKKV